MEAALVGLAVAGLPRIGAAREGVGSERLGHGASAQPHSRDGQAPPIPETHLTPGGRAETDPASAALLGRGGKRAPLTVPGMEPLSG